MRTEKIFGISLAALASSLMLMTSWAATPSSPDLSAKIEVLGNPYASRYKDGTPAVYARNIWDLQVYNGKIYIGGGNSSNEGPAQNAGPVPIYTYLPETGKFETNFTVNDEQIDVFYVFSDGLYTPGHDPKESWELGNFYRMDKEGKWTKYRTIPQGIHTYAMAEFNKLLFAGLGAKGPNSVCISKDAGATWKGAKAPGGRIHSFLTFQDQLYAVGMLSPKWGSISQYDPKNDEFRVRKDIAVNELFPKTKFQEQKPLKIIRPIQMGNKVLYIGAYCHNDHQSIPFGAYVATGGSKSFRVQEIKIPDSACPWDIIVQDGSAYLLLQDESKDKDCIIRVWTSKNLQNWSELFHFKYNTFARSFELLDGDFYFGMGCEVKDAAKWSQDELKPESGNIIRIKLKTSGKEESKELKTPAKTP